MNHNHEVVTVVGMFDSPADARAAVALLHNQNLDIHDVSVVERDAARYDPAFNYAEAPFEYREYTTEEIGDDAVGGLTLGTLVGGTLGTLAGLGALVIPGIGPVVAAGPLIGALIGGTTGAVTGTLLGALIDAFQLPQEHAVVYQERLSAGKTMVAVHAHPAHAPVVRDVFASANAERFDWPENTTESTRYLWV